MFILLIGWNTVQYKYLYLHGNDLQFDFTRKSAQIPNGAIFVEFVFIFTYFYLFPRLLAHWNKMFFILM